jgi:hypothetical protein
MYTEYKSEVRSFFGHCLHVADTRGIPFMVKYVKSTRLAVTRYISGYPLHVTEDVALDKSGWPVWLAGFKPNIEVPERARVLLTLLISFRGLKFAPKLDIGPIVKEWQGSDSVTELEFRHALKVLGVKPWIGEVWPGFHMSTKSGPQGQALTSSLTDLTNLPDTLISDIKILGGKLLGERVDWLLLPRWGSLSLAAVWAKQFPSKTKSFRKLSYFSDKEGKTRVIAILDYWSQSALRGYHSIVNDILRKIKADCTFNQNSIFRTLPLRGPYYSLDLSNATDRMPVALQQRVFSYVFGQEKAEAWTRVLTEYEYTTKEGLRVKYNTGQPMGAYSSWPLMALTHHLIVRVAALRAGHPHFQAYCLLGDDLVIANEAVAKEYLKLCAQLDIPISDAKSHISNDIFEFAKRWFNAGVEFTGFSTPGLRSVWKSYALLHNYLETQAGHGWMLSIDGHPELISAILRHYGKPAQSERIVKLYMVFDSVAKALKTGRESCQFALLADRLETWFGLQVSSKAGLLQSDQRAALAFRALVDAKKRLVERDLKRFQSDSRSLSAKLNGRLRDAFPDLSVQEYRMALGGTSPVGGPIISSSSKGLKGKTLQRSPSPFIAVLNEQIMDSVAEARRYFNVAVSLTSTYNRYRNDQVLPPLAPEAGVLDSSYLNIGIQKYFVSKKVFTMRTAHAIALSEAQIVKITIDTMRLLLSQEVIDWQELQSRLDLATSG